MWWRDEQDANPCLLPKIRTRNAPEYGLDGRLDRRVLGDGTELDYVIDTAGRELSRTSSTGHSRSFTYGPGDHIETATGPTGTVTLSYDAAGRLERTTSPVGAVAYGYDLANRVERVTVEVAGAAYETSYEHDGEGAITRMVDPLGGETTFVRDLAGRLESRTLPNGVVTRWTYDARDRVTSIVHEHVATSTVLASRSYTRATGGEPERIEREDGSSVVLGYDGALRLTSEERFDATGVLRGETAYTFDADGNRETVTRDGVLETYVTSAAAHLDEIVSGGSTVASFAYDGAGRTTSIVRGLESLALGFDPDGDVTSIERGGAPWASYAFDALGRRERVEHAGVTRGYLWGPARGSGLESIHAVADETGAPVAVYVYADDDRPLMRIVPSTGETFYYLEDAQGSTIALADETGAAVGTFEYDAFGEVRVASGPAAALPSDDARRLPAARDVDGCDRALLRAGADV